MPDGLILLVDDEPSILQLARIYLEREGYEVREAANGRAAMDAIQRLTPAVVVLDVMLPEIDGFEVCRRLRAERVTIPIIMLTARDEDIDKILGLELGADDYMTKPFNPRELVARVKAVLRRSNYLSEPSSVALQVGDLRMLPAQSEVTCNGSPLELRTQEFEVLHALMQNAGKVLTREQLLSMAWGYDFFGQTRTVDVHIAQLRRKLSGCRICIETISGVGYKLVERC